MISLNKVFIAGYLTQKPEATTTSTGKTFVHVGIAYNESHHNAAGERIGGASFFDLEAWDKTAEKLANNCDKGSAVLIDGYLKTSAWKTPKGENRSKVKIVVDRVHFLKVKEPEFASHSEPPLKEEDLPF